MLKKFFISLLGTMAGLWISLFLLIICGTMFVGALIGSSSDSSVSIERNSILHFDLSGEITERSQPISFMDFMQNQGRSNAPTLEQMIKSLRSAVKDDNIEGLYLECNGSAMASAAREELLEVIEEFKESGKWVYAYSDSYNQGDYILASTANTVALNPIGSVDIHGVGGTLMFFKGLLDKIGIKMQILKVGTFKSAVEPYILEKISEPARLQMQQYCDTIWNFTAQTIAANRNMPEAEIRDLASKLIFTQSTEFFTKNLVDTLVYKREVDGILASLSGLEADKEPKLISPQDYLASSELLTALDNDKKHIAVYYAIGEIVDAGDGGIVGSTVVDDIVKLADDENVAGLVLRVNSPGGSAFASEQIWNALEYFKSKEKPLYVSMGDYAASGGYYISCGADYIFADRTTITGSIGVFGMIPDFSGLVTDKLGVHFSTVQTNPNAVGMNTLEPLSPDQMAAMQKYVERTYDLFTSRVAEGRKKTQDDVKKIAEGRVWIGADAINLGLVDEIGSLQNTIEALAEKLNMDVTEAKSYPLVEEEMWEKLLRENADFSALKVYDLETLHYIETINKLRNMNPLQARMPDVIIR